MKTDRKHKVRRAILYTITYIMGITFLAAFCLLDSESALPLIAWIISGIYLGCYAWLRGYIERG